MDKPIFTKLPNDKFEIFYVDPPWDYAGGTQHSGKISFDTGSAKAHYPTVKTKDLMTLPVDTISADNSLLFMWATSPHLDQAINLGKAWGFDYKTVAFIWNKCKPNPGFYTMSDSELCLVFKKGKIPQPRGVRNARQTLFEELHEIPRQKHSAKPQEIRQRIEDMFPEQTKIELFARIESNGWTCWGNEVSPSKSDKKDKSVRFE